MNWTSEKPTKPGWHWYRHSGSSEALLVHPAVACDQIVQLPGVARAVTFMTEKLDSGQWAGPLELPAQSPLPLESGLRGL